MNPVDSYKGQYKRPSTAFWAALYDGSPESVHAVMDLIGSRGVTNSPEGLRVYRGATHLLISHGHMVFNTGMGEVFCLPKERFDRCFVEVKP